MIRRSEEPIPAFILVHHQVASTLKYPGMATHAIRPLASQEPVLMLPTLEIDQLRSEMRQVSNEMTKSVRELVEQMACLVREQGQQITSIHHESGSHTTGVWCNHCGQPNHTPPFCPLLKDNQFQQQNRPRGPQQPQPYRHPNAFNEGNSNNSYNRPLEPFCTTCSNRHPLGRCWIQNNIICERCGEHHLTSRCRFPDKVIPLEAPCGDYQK